MTIDAEDASRLVEPVRQRLIAVASDVLPRLAIEDVPTSLRSVARFTPTKRARLGRTALAAALDADTAFRDKVAEAVAASSPSWWPRYGTAPTAASDPVDVAVVAYLTRPDGWHEVVAAATARWSDEQAIGTGPAGELARLEQEVARLRAEARGEPARLRAAVAEAVAAVERDTSALRQTVRDRIRELRAAERERDEACAAVDELVAKVERLDAAHDSELRRLKGRLAEADRAAGAARRVARTERDIDDARVWLLVDTIVQAATGVRRELSLPAPTVRPADAFVSAAGGESGGSAADAAGLEALLLLPHVHLVVDGYNVTKSGYPELPLIDQRTRLIGALATLAAQCGAETTVVFDGGARPPVQPTAPRGVRVLFSAADEIADDLIRRLVRAEPPGRPVLVVTSDRQIVTDTARAGVWAVPSAVLLARLV